MTKYFRVCNAQTGEDFIGYDWNWSSSGPYPKFTKRPQLFAKNPLPTLERYSLLSQGNWPIIEILEIEIHEVVRYPNTAFDFTYFKEFVYKVFNEPYWKLNRNDEISFIKNSVKSGYVFKYILIAENHHEKPLGIATKCKIGHGVRRINPKTSSLGFRVNSVYTFLLLSSEEDLIYAKMQYGEDATDVYDYHEMRRL
jgi:hypothetical protein